MSYDRALPEAARNKLLRRADWRFLLPETAPRRALCLANSFLSKAVATFADVSDVINSDTYDLVVLDSLNRERLAAAFNCLQPGGSIYLESRRSAELMKRVLLDTGFEQPACYRPWPSISHSSCWVPLDEAPAVQHFLKRTQLAQQVDSRAARCIFRMASRLSGITSAIARKPGAATRFERKRGLLLTGGPRCTSKVVRLSFSQEDGLPCLAAKMSRVPESANGLKREAEILAAIAVKRGNLPGVPRVLALRDGSDGSVVETALTGRPLYKSLRRDNYLDLAFQAAEWLAQLADTDDNRPRSDWWPRLVEPALASFTESFGSVVSASALKVTLERLQRLASLPSTCEQRDFSPWNVLLTTDGEFAVHDWESAELNGLPAMDLTYFMAYLTFYRDRVLNFFQRGYHSAPGFRRSYRRLIGGQAFRDCLDLYASKIGVASEQLGPLRLLTWIIHSRSDYRRFTADLGRRPNAGELRRSLFLNLWEEELALQQ